MGTDDRIWNVRRKTIIVTRYDNEATGMRWRRIRSYWDVFPAGSASIGEINNDEWPVRVWKKLNFGGWKLEKGTE
jgi:hypothetical protein